ncbi:hypothetical protein [Leucothrix pacifica]|uniref:Uncharacterized protein n=1 Tax=Leucothrix pacifica TaxID=1247513 RepID=A0A317CNT0_9GAMM|nr:hypothetical protein [Leucothrix pacifica]PWR00167.1 hypothetical protein DKW60_03240 [Leucothrix pacifica]
MLKLLGLLWLSILVIGCKDPMSDQSAGASQSGQQANGFTLASSTQLTIISGDELREFSLIRSESFDGLKLDMTIQEFEPLVLCRVEKGEPVLWSGIGEIIQEWNYEDCGIKLQLSTVDPETPQIISSIMVRQPSELETSRGIQIGSTEQEVMEAYADYLDEDYSVAGDTLVAGSIYGGLVFTFKDNLVDSMFLGAGAE